MSTFGSLWSGSQRNHRQWRVLHACCIFFAGTLLLSQKLYAQTKTDSPDSSLAQVTQQFLHPPDNARIMMRWWWFGTSVTKPELAREITAMKAAGIGGFEIQPVYPLALDDPASGMKNLPYLSSGFLDALHFAATTGQSQGMRVDLTLSSGWPYGGSYLPVSLAAGMLRVVRMPAEPGETSLAVPSISVGEKLLAAFRVDGATDISESHPQNLALEIQDGRLHLDKAISGEQAILFFISSRTGQIVKRPAVGASGFVLDHYDRAAIEDHLHTVGDPLLKAFGEHPPYAVFSDSLEVYGADWTPDFLQQFQQKRGYDLTPYLPDLVEDVGPETLAVRHDWGQTLTELAEENYLEPIHSWAAQHGTLFRAQNYGTPPTILSSNSLVDLPEGENYRWREFSETRWASSASHLYHRPVTSAECWTWLHSPPFRGTPLDLKAEADLDFLNGINQLIGHGWPYSPPSAAEPGWNFYAAGAWNDHNPWWFVMSQVTGYLQRVSYALRQGKPDNDVAIFLPTDDAWANFTPGHASVSEQMRNLLGPDIIPQILDAGFNFDYIDAAAIAKVGIPYRVLILPGVTRIPLATYRALVAYEQRGGIVIATRSLPSLAPGLLHAAEESSQIDQISNRLFKTTRAPGHFLEKEQQLGGTLQQLLQPDVSITPQTYDIGVVHRKLADADLYFLVNTSNQMRTFYAKFRVAETNAQWWNPDSGAVMWAANNNRLQISLQPYESRILVFTHDPATLAAQQPSLTLLSRDIDLSADWKVTFLQNNKTVEYEKLHSWTGDSATHFYSGQAAYEKTIRVPEALLAPGVAVHLNFGQGTVVTQRQRKNPGMRAMLESPIREAAQIYVNGKLAGSVWHPPYEIDITRLLQHGNNQLRIVAGNLAINEIAGRSLPGYRLLNSRYGKRFEPQDEDNLHPLPSGLLGPVHLVFYRQAINK